MTKHLVIKEDTTKDLLNELTGELLIQNPRKAWTAEQVCIHAFKVALKKIRTGV